MNTTKENKPPKYKPLQKEEITMKMTKIAALLASIMICLSAAGCSVSQETSAAGSDSSVSETAEGKEAKDTNEKTSNGSVSGSSTSVEKLDTSDIFSNRDLKQEADLDGAKQLTVKDGETLNITEEGVYVLSGSAKNCTVRIEAGNDAKIQLVLDGVKIENDDFPAIYVTSADKVFVTTTDTVNTLSVSGDFKADGESNTDAVIFSKDDIVFNGKGTLEITSAKANGISGKDDVKFTGGTYKITSEKDAVEAHDSIAVADGTFEINSSKDGLHAENDDDDTVGYIYIAGGSFKITAKSDSVQATTIAQIDGGTLELSSAEGIEGTRVIINGGEITVNASDDGVNGSQKSNSVGKPAFEMNGGTLKITMKGNDTDAIDINGSVYVNGGTIDITSDLKGSSESFDYDDKAEFNGGKIIINGEEVDEIPTPMMMGGGRNGGGFPGGQGKSFGRNGDMTPPEGFDPENFDPENLPEGFDKDKMPGNFDPDNLPEGFDKSKIPDNFDPENMPEDFKKGNFKRSNGDSTDSQTPTRRNMKQSNSTTASTDANV